MTGNDDTGPEERDEQPSTTPGTSFLQMFLEAENSPGQN